MIRNKPVIEYLKDIPAMSVGSPCPQLLAGEKTKILFHSTTYEENNQDKEDIILIEFQGAIFHKFGVPNEEALEGHPLYKIGLKRFDFHKIVNSKLINELEKNNRVHMYHNPELYWKTNHYIFVFHDETFECIANGYTVKVFKDTSDMKKTLIEEIGDSNISTDSLFE